MDTKDSLRVELFRFWGIFDIVSSDLCLNLFNLRVVQSASQYVKKSTRCSKGMRVKGILNDVKKMHLFCKLGPPLGLTHLFKDGQKFRIFIGVGG